LAAVLYFGIASIAAMLFAAGALAAGEEWVAVLGGAAWVFFLALIVSMPLVIPAITERARRGER
jgi:hypothetical protein